MKDELCKGAVIVRGGGVIRWGGWGRGAGGGRPGDTDRGEAIVWLNKRLSRAPYVCSATALLKNIANERDQVENTRLSQKGWCRRKLKLGLAFHLPLKFLHMAVLSIKTNAFY